MMSPMRSALPIAVVSALAALLCACQAELEAAGEVTKLRILGVQADPPEISPGEATAIRILSADPKGEGRRVVGGGIVVPGLFTPSSAPDATDLPQLFFALPFTDAGQQGVVSFPDQLMIPEYTLDPQNAHVPIAPPGEPLTMTAILFVCAGDGFDENAAYAVIGELTMGGAAEATGPLAFEDICTRAGADEGVTAIKTFDVVTCDPATSTLSCDGEYAPNANPEIDSVTFDGEPLSPFVGGVCLECDAKDGCRTPMKASAAMTADSFQRYERPIAANLSGTEVVYERTYISWFATGGKFDVERSGNGSTIDNVLPDEPFEAMWMPPPGGGEFTVWAVAHDVRGGVSWEIFHVTAGVPE
jgi:hypothetical protein